MAILITLATITACLILWEATALNEKIQKKNKKKVLTKSTNCGTIQLSRGEVSPSPKGEVRYPPPHKRFSKKFEKSS